MFRAWIAIVVLIGGAVDQATSIPHAHAGMTSEQRRAHDRTPHVHLDHPAHDHHEHGHRHDDRGGELPEAGPGESPRPQDAVPADVGRPACHEVSARTIATEGLACRLMAVGTVMPYDGCHCASHDATACCCPSILLAVVVDDDAVRDVLGPSGSDGVAWEATPPAVTGPASRRISGRRPTARHRGVSTFLALQNLRI
jgi:hypothetical protein